MQWFETEAEPGLNGRRIALPRGKGTGGSTLVNGQIWIRGQAEDFDGWRDGGCPGWGFQDLLPYFKKSEHFEPLADPSSDAHLPAAADRKANPIDPAFHGTGGPITLAHMRAINPLAETFLRAAKAAGHRFNGDFNGARQDGVGFYTFTHKRGERVTAESAYIDPIRNRPNLTILPERRVARILMDGTRATGVAWTGPEGDGETRARETILSAGSFVSPHLLMLSGIGPPEDLAAQGIPVVAPLPGVGKNLQDHLDVTLEYKARTLAPYGGSLRALPRNVLHVLDWIFRRRGVFASTTAECGGFLSTTGEGRPDIQLFFCTGMANTQNAKGFSTHGFMLHVCDLRPRSVGSLRLTSADPGTPPAIRYNFFEGDSRPDTLRRGIRIARGIIAQPPFRPHMGHEMAPGDAAQEDAALDAFIKATVGTLFHPVGTCAMGTGPDAVVDPATMCVHGTTGLRVVDASIMPSIPSGNTVAATYALAEKAADLIRGR